MKPIVQLIAITLADDGSLAVMQFITDDGTTQREAAEDAITAEIAKAGLQAQSWRRIDPTDLPADRTYRDAWTDDGKSIAVDPGKQANIDAARASAPNLMGLQAALVAKGVLTDADVTAASMAFAAQPASPTA